MPNPWIALFLKIHHCQQHAPTIQDQAGAVEMVDGILPIAQGHMLGSPTQLKLEAPHRPRGGAACLVHDDHQLQRLAKGDGQSAPKGIFFFCVFADLTASEEEALLAWRHSKLLLNLFHHFRETHLLAQGQLAPTPVKHCHLDFSSSCPNKAHGVQIRLLFGLLFTFFQDVKIFKSSTGSVAVSDGCLELLTIRCGQRFPALWTMREAL